MKVNKRVSFKKKLEIPQVNDLIYTSYFIKQRYNILIT